MSTIIIIGKELLQHSIIHKRQYGKIDCFLRIPHEFHKGNLMLTMMCTGVIQQSFDAGSYTMGNKKAIS